MVVISKAILTEFGKKHADAIEPLNEWWKKATGADGRPFRMYGTHSIQRTLWGTTATCSTSKEINTGWLP